MLSKIQNDKTVFLARGCVFYDMGNYKNAIDDFKQAIELDSSMPEGYYRVGLCKFAQRDYQSAIFEFKEAKAKEQALSDDHRLKPNQKNWGIRDGLGQAYHALCNFDKAIEFYEIAIENCPENIEFLTHRAKCYHDQGAFEQSVEDLMKGLEMAPNNPELMYRLGLSHFANEDYKNAIKYLKVCLLNNPFDSFLADTYYHIGLSYCLTEKYEKAIFPFTKCIEAVPSDFNYVHERAKAYQMIEDHENAVADFDVVI